MSSSSQTREQDWRVDETYLKIQGQDRYLWRAVDSTGQTIDCLLTAKRDSETAKRFFQKALQAEANSQPRVINVGRTQPFPLALEQLKAEGTLRQRCRLRECKFLNDVLKQDHRLLRKKVWPANGYSSFLSAADRTRD